MEELVVESPFTEQEICVKCGLCCDGTLFSHAVLQKGERGNLPEKIEQQYGKEGESEFFTLPCAYFEGKCTIYNQKKAVVCSAFRCQLLKTFANGDVSQKDAIKIVTDALKFKAEIYQFYKQTFGVEFKLSFRELLAELNKMSPDTDPPNVPVELLRMKCNIYQTLLIKNFKSIKTFESMIESTVE
ncbi:hypothetical protein DR864_23660 [Runella rosea]|uniref:YkgJ family cysteine cluster protein n=1 Tax=Runella rosea TaxID=2259595 RepID=A0A344TPE8_9BACT|nr:hypothetical protein [Runella rosea]AXE20519.1 hypothetical protein DR864_23660 [Runella rosea]